jgi:dTDP-4-amino-4,6-dideoxygalactose transaminase
MSPGPIAQLEAAFAARWGAPAVATGFGRGALYLALEAVGVRNADVLVPELICMQVLRAIERAGGRPLFYPVPLDLSVEPAALQGAITPGTRAAILVHYYGMPQPHVRALVEICAARGVHTIEDCSLALLARHPQGLCGTFADYATFSFTKNNWCFGGGMVIAREAAAVSTMQRIRAATFTADDELCAAYGRLSRLDCQANRPLLARAAAEEGMRLQLSIAERDPRFSAENFFDVPPCHVLMSTRAAQRALRILATAEESARRRRTLLRRLAAALPASPAEDTLSRRSSDFEPRFPSNLAQPQTWPTSHTNGSFLVLFLPQGNARHAAERAARQGITLRMAWPGFQATVPQTPHADHLCFLEIPEAFDVEETKLISQWLAAMAWC